ncbi:lipopolysaccharide heptosyltransferase I [Candidatus Thioglobus autotrophicus]|uniref:lipopolysaccharide heptosyltransferase I n=1 Tax=Candidatus Thioglobus autotrophicus TaxID=1705394 RepID=UPI00299EF4CE|nr:lipopolysaccharide heptosyltransferase I [Candidatus Thioglobus autotrophicus]WPE17801.1 lipopolysaccharide heptosyltransferase I [Candidatus Thioglobus autotrophicus]
MRIAIVKLSALGDIIHAMVALQFIKHHLPDSSIDWIVEEGFKDILMNNPDINAIHTVNIKQAKKNKSLSLLFKEFKKLRKLPRYDLVIDLQGLIKSALVSRITPSDKTFGFDKNSLRESFAAWFYTDTCKIGYDENIINRNTTVIASALGITITHNEILNKQPFLFSNNKILPSVISDKKANIALIPGASFKSKIYPLEQYAKIAQELDANFIVLWGNELEKNMAQQIQKIAPAVQVADKLTLDELKVFIEKMDLVIGGDTGPTHMAWALNVPSITLFGSTPGYRNTYATNINHILESESKVDPYKIDKNDFSIKTIKVNYIVKITKKLLKDKPCK